MTHPASTISGSAEAGVEASRNSNAGGWRTVLVVVLLVVGGWMLCLRNPVVWRATGIGDTPVPFLDLYGLLAAGELAQAHGDPFGLNPLDPYNRPHVYTAWWLATGAIGLTRADSSWLGHAMLGLSLIAAVVLIRPRGTREALHTVLVLCSPAVLMAVNRGNNDWVVFAVGCAALGCLRFDSVSVRSLGVVLLAVCAALKYYPLAALVVLLSARTRREWSLSLALFALVLVLGWPALKPGLESAARFKPSPDGLFAFGAPNLFRALGFQSAASWLIPSVALGAWGCWLAQGHWRSRPAAASASSWEREFACGAALLAGCFFLGASYVYKMIFAVWLLPWFWRASPAGAEKNWHRAGAWLLLAVLWLEGVLALVINRVISPWSTGVAVRVLDVTLVVAQLLTWGLVACLVRRLVFYCVDRIHWLLRVEASATVAR